MEFLKTFKLHTKLIQYKIFISFGINDLGYFLNYQHFSLK